jgi:hypothetical protein
MALIAVNGAGVEELHLTFPENGPWIADVAFGADVAPQGTATLACEGRNLVGTFIRADELAGLVRARIVGGRGGLRKQVKEGHFRSAAVRNILTDTLSSVREAQSPACAPGVVNTVLPSWTRIRGTASEAVATLAENFAVSWRVRDDGTVWLGTDAFAASQSTALVLDKDVRHGFALVAPDALDLDVGTVFNGDRVRRVSYSFEDDGALRARYWWH